MPYYTKKVLTLYNQDLMMTEHIDTYLCARFYVLCYYSHSMVAGGFDEMS